MTGSTLKSPGPWPFPPPRLPKDIAKSKKVDIGRWRHGKFQEEVEKFRKKFAELGEFILTEQSINKEGDRIKMQRWENDYGEIVQRYAKGSRRPDVIVLNETLEPDVKSLRGRVSSVVDLKTGGAHLDKVWTTDVADRLMLSEDQILEVKKGSGLVKRFDEAKEAGAKYRKGLRDKANAVIDEIQEAERTKRKQRAARRAADKKAANNEYGTVTGNTAEESEGLLSWFFGIIGRKLGGANVEFGGESGSSKKKEKKEDNPVMQELDYDEE